MSHVENRNGVAALITATMITVACGGGIDVEPLSQQADPGIAQADVQRRVPGGNARFAEMRRADGSGQFAEWSRLNSLRPRDDGSTQFAEQNRFNALKEIGDGSWEVAEFRAMSN